MKLAVTLTVTLIVLSIATFHVWRKLQDEKDRLTELEKHVAFESTANITSELRKPNREASSALSKPPESNLTSAATRTADTLIIEDIEDLQVAYSDLARDLGLTQFEANEFLRLLSRQRLEITGVIRGAIQTGKSPSEAMSMVQKKMLSNETEQATALGIKYPVWKQYQVAVVARKQVKDLQSLLAAKGNTLTEQTADQLAAAIAPEIEEVNKEFQKRIAAIPPGQPVMGLAVALPTQQKNETNRRVIAIAASYLSASQLDQFKQMLTQSGSRSPHQIGAAE